MTSGHPLSGAQVDFLQMAEQLVKTAALLSAFGYVSLRTFCNMYGFPIPPGLGVEYYLREAADLVYNIAESISSGCALIAVIVVVAALLHSHTQLFRRLHSKMHLPVGKPRLWMLCSSVTAVFFGFGQILRHLPYDTESVVVGPISVRELPAPQPNLFDATLYLTILAWASYVLLSRNPVDTGVVAVSYSQTLLRLLLIGATLSTIYIPFAHGVSLRSRKLSIVRVQINGVAVPVCSVQILQTSTQLLLWQAENGAGRAQLLPLSSIVSITLVRQDDILNLARQASAIASLARPTCN